MDYLMGEIPVDATADQMFRIALGGADYTLRLMWNSRGKYWALSVFDPDGTPRIEGERLVVGWPFAVDYPQARVRYGVLMLTGEESESMDREDLGSNLKLCFVTLER